MNHFVYNMGNSTSHKGNKMKYRTNTPSTLLKDTLNEWANRYYHPKYFLTVQFPEWEQKNNPWDAQENLRDVMSCFERQLLGRHWNNKHLPFMVFTEKNESYGWHYHILLGKQNFSKRILNKAISATTTIKGIPYYSMLLLPINKTKDKVFYYSEKGLHVNQKFQFNSDRIILSHDLFHLPYQKLSEGNFNSLIFLWILSYLIKKEPIKHS